MFVSDCLGVSPDGHLTIGGYDTVALAAKYGTPAYVMDEGNIRQSCQQFKASIDEYYDGNGLVLYASKAFSCKEIYRVVASEGLGADVVSGGELYTALKAGFPANRIYFHGNNKTREELVMALDAGVHRIVVDNLTELAVLDKLAQEKGKVVDILFRIKPGIDAHTHAFIRTGQIDSKFGLALENGEAMEAVREALSFQNVNLAGLHCHIGSQIHEIEPFELAAEVMLTFIKKIFDETGFLVKELNLGGGFGIKYTDEDRPQKYIAYMQRVSTVVKKKAAQFGLPVPFVLIEPGRSIAAPAGITLYTVGAVKEIAGVRNYVSIDGGMVDNPRYALYKSSYEVLVANRAAAPKDYVATIAGRCCESGDLIQENARIQKPAPGDIVAVLATGAYNYSMASNYNRIPRPPVVFVKDGESRVVVKRESFEDLVQNDL